MKPLLACLLLSLATACAAREAAVEEASPTAAARSAERDGLAALPKPARRALTIAARPDGVPMLALLRDLADACDVRLLVAERDLQLELEEVRIEVERDERVPAEEALLHVEGLLRTAGYELAVAPAGLAAARRADSSARAGGLLVVRRIDAAAASGSAGAPLVSLDHPDELARHPAVRVQALVELVHADPEELARAAEQATGDLHVLSAFPVGRTVWLRGLASDVAAAARLLQELDRPR